MLAEADQKKASFFIHEKISIKDKIKNWSLPNEAKDWAANPESNPSPSILRLLKDKTLKNIETAFKKDLLNENTFARGELEDPLLLKWEEWMEWGKVKLKLLPYSAQFCQNYIDELTFRFNLLNELIYNDPTSKNFKWVSQWRQEYIKIINTDLKKDKLHSCLLVFENLLSKDFSLPWPIDRMFFQLSYSLHPKERKHLERAIERLVNSPHLTLKETLAQIKIGTTHRIQPLLTHWDEIMTQLKATEEQLLAQTQLYFLCLLYEKKIGSWPQNIKELNSSFPQLINNLQKTTEKLIFPKKE